jgi:hypothetical protein
MKSDRIDLTNRASLISSGSGADIVMDNPQSSGNDDDGGFVEEISSNTSVVEECLFDVGRNGMG